MIADGVPVFTTREEGSCMKVEQLAVEVVVNQVTSKGRRSIGRGMGGSFQVY